MREFLERWMLTPERDGAVPVVWDHFLGAGPVRFLLVEDDADHAEIFKRSLKEAHISNVVYWVRNGQTALDFLRRCGQFRNCESVDAVILDLKLPRKDGHEVLSEIREDPNLMDLPVIVVSTSTAEVDRMRAFKHRANSYLVKPLEVDRLNSLLDELSCTRVYTRSRT